MIDRTDNAKTNNLYSPPPNCWLFILDVDSDVFIIDIIIACLCEERERVNGWCVEVVRRVDGTSNQAQPRRGPMLISEVMSQWRWSIGVVRPNDGGSLWCTIFYSAWFGTERKLKKKVVARCKQATNHETEGFPLLYILWRWVMFLQGSDLLHACNGTRSTLLAVIFR